MKKLYGTIMIHKQIMDKQKGVDENINYYKLKNKMYGIEIVKENEEKEKLEIANLMNVTDSEEAINHINKYGTKHSDCILTKNMENAEEFLKKIDSACVYVNASTRFSDGGEFGFGAELGISTQKLHARGPMGLREMTTYKYKIYGEGQVR